MQATAFEITISFIIIGRTIAGIMLIPIQFYYKLSSMAIKINDKTSNNTLTIKLNRVLLQKAIPKTAFLPSHVLA